MDELLTRVSVIERWARLRTDLAEARKGSAPAQLATFDLDGLVNEVVADATARAASQGWQLGVYRHPSPLGTVRSDPVLISRVLTHLVDASIDARVDTGTQGQVQCKLSYESESLHIDLVDNGPGLAQERLDQWFRDWDFGHAVPSNDADGLTTWRLLVVRALVHQMGGRFDARSTPGHGNRWSADLPLARLPAAASPIV